jgi:hypothetical protein
MKKIISFFLSMAITLSSLAQTAVQRTTESSLEDYRKYLEKSGGTSFSQAYIQLSSVTTLETPLLEKCLEEMYLGAPSQSTCLSAVKSLGAKPLNQPRREVLYSFLSKMTKVKSPNRSFYQGLRDGLLRTHSDLAKTFQAEIPEAEDKAPEVKSLEMKAWKNALAKKIPLDEVSLLINGKKVSKLESWTAPEGIYQWALISNTHEPFIRFATFSQFAAESLKSLEPLATGGCNQLEKLEPQKFGLLRMEVFATSKCVAQFGMSTSVEEKSEHLGSSSNMVQMEKSSSRHWVWITLAIVGAGVAAGLKGKNVQVQWPGSN